MQIAVSPQAEVPGERVPSTPRGRCPRNRAVLLAEPPAPVPGPRPGCRLAGLPALPGMLVPRPPCCRSGRDRGRRGHLARAGVCAGGRPASTGGRPGRRGHRCRPAARGRPARRRPRLGHRGQPGRASPGARGVVRLRRTAPVGPGVSSSGRPATRTWGQPLRGSSAHSSIWHRGSPAPGPSGRLTAVAVPFAVRRRREARCRGTVRGDRPGWRRGVSRSRRGRRLRRRPAQPPRGRSAPRGPRRRAAPTPHGLRTSWLPSSARAGAAKPTSRSPPVSNPTAVSLRPFLMCPLLEACPARPRAALRRWCRCRPTQASAPGTVRIFPADSRSNRSHEAGGEDQQRQHRDERDQLRDVAPAAASHRRAEGTRVSTSRTAPVTASSSARARARSAAGRRC